MNEFPLETVLISLATSVVAGILVAYYLKFKERQIRKQIEELNSYEQYLEKLSKGNIKLLRSSLLLIFICLFIFFFVSFVVLLGVSMNLGPAGTKIMLALAGTPLCTGAFLCAYHMRSIVHSADLPKAKEYLKRKRKKLESKVT